MVDSCVELRLFLFASALQRADLCVETCEGLFIDGADCVVSMGSLVGRVVIHSERALGAHELWHSRVVVRRDLLAVEGSLDFTHVLYYAW